MSFHVNKKIPKRLIQFWNDKPTIPQVYQAALDTNKNFTTDLDILFVDDDYMLAFLKSKPFLHDLYKKLRVESIKSDIARLTLLYEYGGIYMDMSMVLHKAIYPLLDSESELVLLQRDDQPRYEKYPDQAHIGAMLMASAPKSPFIACCLSALIDTIVKGHYNHHILFGATKYTDDTYNHYLDLKDKPTLAIQLLSFKALKKGTLEHLRIEGLQNSWRVHERDGIFDPKDLNQLQKHYTKLPCSLLEIKAKTNEPIVDFMGIGVQNSATSWLSKNLRNHPECWLPPRKELHYFDRSLQYPSPSFLATDDFQERLKSNEEHNIKFRKKMHNIFDNIKINGSMSTLNWFKCYLYGTPSAAWYRSLFLEGEGKIKGEITPAYSILTKQDIMHIKTLFPQIKIILLLRDPIERAWSQIRFFMKVGRLRQDSSIEEIKALIESPIQVTRGDYLDILQRWQSVFPSSQIFIGYYDEIQESPQKFLYKVFDFLGLDTTKSTYKSIDEQINVSISKEIPPEIKSYLKEKYLEEMKILSTILPSEYIKKWILKYATEK